MPCAHKCCFYGLQETDRELILRFFAMHGHMAQYRMPLSNFLNDEADRSISLTQEQLQQRQELFEKAIGNVSLSVGAAARIVTQTMGHAA